MTPFDIYTLALGVTVLCSIGSVLLLAGRHERREREKVNVKAPAE